MSTPPASRVLLMPWDAAACVKPIGLHLRAVEEVGCGSAGLIVQRSTLHVSLRANAQQSGYFRFEGRLPRTGLHWIGIALNAGAYFTLHFGALSSLGRKPSTLEVTFSNRLISVTYGGVVQHLFEGVVTEGVLAFDLDTGMLTWHVKGQLVGRVALNAAALAGPFLMGSLHDWEEQGVGMRINATRPMRAHLDADTQARAQLLTLEAALPPDGDQRGRFLEATTGAEGRLETIFPGVLYIEGREQVHRMTSNVAHELGLVLQAFDHPIVLGSQILFGQPGSFHIGPTNALSEITGQLRNFSESYVLGSINPHTHTSVNVSILGRFWSGALSQLNVVGIGSGLQSIKGALEDVIAVGEQVGARLNRAHQSLLLGHQVLGEAQGHVEGSVLAGHGLARSWTGVGQITHTVAVGAEALQATPGSSRSIAIGHLSASRMGGPLTRATVVGAESAFKSPAVEDAVVVGLRAASESSVTESVVVGNYAGAFRRSVSQSTIIGHQSQWSGRHVHNVITLGYRATAWDSNQVVLGNADNYLLQARSGYQLADSRDMALPERAKLGMQFLLGLEPLQYFYNPRERTYPPQISTPPEPMRRAPQPPEGNDREEWVRHEAQMRIWEADFANHQQLTVQHLRIVKAAQALGGQLGTMDQADAGISYGFDGDNLKAAAAAASQIYHGTLETGGRQFNDDRAVLVALVNGYQELHDYLHGESFLDKVAERMLLKQEQRRNR